MLKVDEANVQYLQMNFNQPKIPYPCKIRTENCRTAAEWKPSFFYRSGAAWSRLGVVLLVADTAESHLQNMAKYVASRFWLLFRLQNTVFVAVWRHGCVGGTPIVGSIGLGLNCSAFCEELRVSSSLTVCSSIVVDTLPFVVLGARTNNKGIQPTTLLLYV